MKPSPADEPLWSIEQVAEYLDIPVETLRFWRKNRGGPPSFRLGNHVRYRPEAVRAFVADRERTDHLARDVGATKYDDFHDRRFGAAVPPQGSGRDRNTRGGRADPGPSAAGAAVRARRSTPHGPPAA